MFSLSVAELQDRRSGIYNALTSLWQSYGRGVQNSACSPLADCGLGACSPLADCGLGACSPLADCGLGACSPLADCGLGACSPLADCGLGACSPLADCGLGACSPLADCGLGACSPLADCGLGAQESIRFQHSVAEFRSRCSGIYMFSLLCGRVLFQVFRDQHVLTSVW